jgi:hypothetical protein
MAQLDSFFGGLTKLFDRTAACCPMGLCSRGFVVLFISVWLAACRDNQIAVYRIPKEIDSPAAATTPVPAGMAGAQNGAGLAVAKADGTGLEWTPPVHWKSKVASAMRKGSYSVGGDGPAGADLAITAFPGNVGGDLANVNRWRGQLQLAPITEPELAAAVTPLEANGLKMLVVDLAGGGADSPQRMLGAIVPHEGATWFFKLTGPAALVATEKPGYLEFLRTVRSVASTTASAPVSSPPAPVMTEPPPPIVSNADGPGLKWTAPAHWVSKPATAMRKATYVIPGDAGATAELSVTAFPGAVGGELANVNRWRGQLQLSPLAEADLPGTLSHLTVNGLSVTLVDLSGGPAEKPQRMLGAIVPSNGSNWFFKLTGPSSVVAAEKPAFLTFLQTLQAP